MTGKKIAVTAQGESALLSAYLLVGDQLELAALELRIRERHEQDYKALDWLNNRVADLEAHKAELGQMIDELDAQDDQADDLGEGV